MEANYQLSLEFIQEKFSPDLNSMQVQDKPVLAKQKSQAQKLFENSFRKKETVVEHSDEMIQITVNEAFIRNEKLCKKDRDLFRKGMVTEAERIYNHYIAVLSLAVAFADVAKADKKVSHKNFVSNAWIEAISDSEELKKESLRLGRSWDGKMVMVRSWFRDVVREDGEYQSNLDRKKPSMDEQKKFANYFFRKIKMGKKNIKDQNEEKDKITVEDKENLKGNLEKNKKDFDPEEKEAQPIHPMKKNSDDHRQ
jgi:N utilization substance protein B